MDSLVTLIGYVDERWEKMVHLKQKLIILHLQKLCSCFSIPHPTNPVWLRGVSLTRTELTVVRPASHYLVVFPKSLLAPVRTTGAFSGKENTLYLVYTFRAHRVPAACLGTQGKVIALEPEGKHTDVCAQAGWNNPDTLQPEKTTGATSCSSECGVGPSPLFEEI